MNNVKKIVLVVSPLILTSLYAAQEKNVDLSMFVNPKDVSSKLSQAWNFAQDAQDANFLELAAKIKKIQTCTDCSIAEKRLFITLLNNPGINLFENIVTKNKIFVDNLAKYKNYGETCDTGNIKKCKLGLTNSILRDMLRDALKNNRLGLIKLLIDARVNIQGDPATNTSPLIQAINADHKETVQLFIDKGVNVNFKGYGGNTALKAAEQKGNKEIITLLKEAGAK